MIDRIESQSFGSLLKKVVDNRGKTCPVVGKGIPLIATNCISNNHLYPQFEKVRYVDVDVYENWFRGHPEPEDMIFVLKGTPGRVAWVPNPVGFCIAQDMVAIRPDEMKIYPKYLFAVLRSKTIQQEIEGLHVGTLIPHFKKGDFDDLQIPIVDKDLQKFIGNQYFDISSKIDLLHRQNQTLEAMAASLFRQWFVEEAQEDWEEVKLGDFFPVVTGKRDANFSTDDGEYPFFTCSQAVLKAPSFSFEGAAILLTGNGDFNVKRFIGKFEAYQRTYVLIPYDVKYFSFLYTLMRFYLSEITGGHQGSVINFITKGMITEFKFNLPNEHINIDEKLAKFNGLYAKIDSNNSQIKTLEKLRDTLLPKLMSGEVRVKV
jgi:type I restriction enzyme, S subunit